MARILITSAIPYINGIKHLGNLAGSMLPADVYARYCRAAGHEVLFICATDEHGTPAELAALEVGQDVADYCAEQHEILVGGPPHERMRRIDEDDRRLRARDQLCRAARDHEARLRIVARLLGPIVTFTPFGAPVDVRPGEKVRIRNGWTWHVRGSSHDRHCVGRWRSRSGF